MKTLITLFIFLIVIGQANAAALKGVNTIKGASFDATVYTSEDACITGLDKAGLENDEAKLDQCMDQAYDGEAYDQENGDLFN